MKYRLDQLPPALRAQIEKQIAKEDAAASGNPGPCSGPLVTPEQPNSKKERKLAPKAQTKTEADFNRRYLAGAGMFEAMAFKMPGGSRYTPDFVTYDEKNKIYSCYEVKGSFKLSSHGRALTAFKETAAAFPGIRFFWATRQDDGTYTLREYERE
jgi:hypothetical protein